MEKRGLEGPFIFFIGGVILALLSLSLFFFPDVILYFDDTKIETTIYIFQKDIDKVNDKYSFFSKESGFCIYSNNVTDLEIYVSEITEGTYITQTNDEVKFYCKDKENLIGRLHTHPYFMNQFSEQDIFSFTRSFINNEEQNEIYGILYFYDMLNFISIKDNEIIKNKVVILR